MTLELKPRGGRLWIMGSWNGKRIRVTTKCSVEDRAGAIKILRDYEQRLALGETPRIASRKSGRTFSEACDVYLGRPEGVAPNDRRYVERWRIAFGHLLLDDVTAEVIQKRVAKDFAGQKPGSVRRALTILKAVLRMAYDLEWLTRMPKIRMPRVDDERDRHLTEPEVESLINACTGAEAFMRPLVTFMLYTGCRPNEAIKLDWQDVDIPRRVVTLRSKKGKKQVIRRVPLHTKVVAALLSTPERTGRVFRNTRGKPWAVREGQSCAVYRHWRRVIERSGVENFRPYDCRHTFATDLLDSGADLRDVGELLGHASMNTTKRYVHIKSRRLTDVVERLR